MNAARFIEWLRVLAIVATLGFCFGVLLALL
jgi:hypothetical protein